MRPSRRFRAVCAITLTLLAGCGAYALMLVATSNFHEVVAGELYRSAQPTPQRLTAYHDQFGIRTVLNLRGAHPGQAWYDEEAKTAKQLGVELIDFPLSAKRELNMAEVRALTRIMEDAPKPLLVHCLSGADRTGIASAIYLATVSKASEETAEWQLTPVFGHIPLWFTAAFAMDETFEANEPNFGYYGS